MKLNSYERSSHDWRELAKAVYEEERDWREREEGDDDRDEEYYD